MDREAVWVVDRQTDGQSGSLGSGQTNKQMDREAVWVVDRQTNRWTERQSG